MLNRYAKFAWVPISLSVLLTSVAQLLFRMAMKQGALAPDNGMSLIASISNGFTAVDALTLFVGILLYGVSLIVWVIALTHYPVSFAYPMLSISYILVYIAATRIPALDESPNLTQTIGIGVIVVGIWFLSRERRGT